MYERTNFIKLEICLAPLSKLFHKMERERERENLSTSAKKKVTTGDKLEKVDAKVAVVYCIPRKNKY
jgi:hypothetical protein